MASEDLTASRPKPPVSQAYYMHQRLPTFSGDSFDHITAEEWAEEMRCGTERMDPVSAAAFVIDHLTGPARREVQRLTKENRKCPESLLKTVEENFGDRRTPAAIRGAFYSRDQRPYETVREYYNSLDSLSLLLERKAGKDEAITPKCFCERFVEGLRSVSLRQELRRKIKDGTWISCDHIRRAALDGEMEQEAISTAPEINAAVAAQTALTAQLEALTARMEQLQAASSAPPSAPITTCAFCRKRGHTAVECRTRQRKEADNRPSTTQQMGNMKCYFCLEWGHIQRNCPQLSAPSDSRMDRQPLGSGRPAPRDTRPPQRQGNLTFPQ